MTATEMVPATRAVVPTLREQLQAVKDLIAKDCTDAELDLFARVCERTGLDPFARQIYAIKRAGKLGIQTSIDGFRLLAQRTSKYRGQLGPFWCGDDGAWKDVWLSSKAPAAARVGIIHRDFAEPVWSVARFADYQAGGPMWQKMGPTMIAKCAEALGLRRCFPQELSGIYTGEEMDQAGAGQTMAGELPHYVPPPAPVGPNVPVPNKNGRGAWPKAVSEHHTVTATREIDEAYARTVNDGAAPSDLEVQLQRSIDAVTVEVIDHVTGEVSKQPKATAAQLKKLHAMVTQLKIDDKAYRAGLRKYYKCDSSKLLTKAQCADMIERLEITKARVPADMLPPDPPEDRVVGADDEDRGDDPMLEA